jgi:hypothetical protein
MRRCTDLLRDFLASLGTPEAANLLNATNLVVSAVDLNDPLMYDDAENNFADTYAATSAELQQQIQDFLLANGCFWPDDPE